MELNARVHAEDGSYWAEVTELPGCFASGTTLDELTDALRESIQMYMNESGTPARAVQLDELRLSL
jgi:predicted RNase H-like HicB family nuclease